MYKTHAQTTAPLHRLSLTERTKGSAYDSVQFRTSTPSSEPEERESVSAAAERWPVCLWKCAVALADGWTEAGVDGLANDALGRPSGADLTTARSRTAPMAAIIGLSKVNAS